MNPQNPRSPSLQPVRRLFQRRGTLQPSPRLSTPDRSGTLLRQDSLPPCLPTTSITLHLVLKNVSETPIRIMSRQVARTILNTTLRAAHAII